jgi:hypothetical protein
MDLLDVVAEMFERLNAGPVTCEATEGQLGASSVMVPMTSRLWFSSDWDLSARHCVSCGILSA